MQLKAQALPFPLTLITGLQDETLCTTGREIHLLMQICAARAIGAQEHHSTPHPLDDLHPSCSGLSKRQCCLHLFLQLSHVESILNIAEA